MRCSAFQPPEWKEGGNKFGEADVLYLPYSPQLTVSLCFDRHLEPLQEGKHICGRCSTYLWKLEPMRTQGCQLCTADTPAFSQFLKSAKFSPATGPLHILFPLLE